MRLLLYTDAARDDINDITFRIAVESMSREIATAFARRLVEHCAKLAELPGTLGSARPDLLQGLRSTPHEGHVIFFRYAADSVEIINILHGARDANDYYAH